MSFLRKFVFHILVLCSLLTLGHSTAFCEEIINPDSQEVLQALSNRPLSENQQQLLTLAFQTASKMPLEPHIKNRSRAQEDIVLACLKLDQPKRAFQYARQIANWRRGSCYADIAFYCVEHQISKPVETLLQMAHEVTEEAGDWRKDRIHVKIAQTHALLGNKTKAEELQSGVVDSEMGKVAGIQAQNSAEDTFGQQVKNLDTLTASGIFDVIKNALFAYTNLYENHYENEERRKLIEENIKSAWNPIPVFIRMDLLMRMTETALDYSDRNKAAQLVEEANTVLTSHEWPLEYFIPAKARVAALQYQAGNQEEARANIDTALGVYQEKGKQIVNIYRADALIPLAESYQKMEETASALAVYAMAVEEAVVNPNSRPRAEDLSAVCVSMALYNIKPSPLLQNRMKEIVEGLSDPW